MSSHIDRAIEADESARRQIGHDLGRTLFVEAGAGTGKTTALVSRILELVLTENESLRVPLANIAAITFTEAAAAELRQRIRDKIEERLHGAVASGDARSQRLCTEALEDSDVAAISTLHSFAQRLLSEFPVEVEIPPRVEVIDEVQSQLAFDDRWETFVDQLFGDRDVEEFIVRASILGIKIASRDSPLRVIAHNFDDNWDRLEHIVERPPIAAPIDWQSLQSLIDDLLHEITHCTDPSDKLLNFVERAGLHRFSKAANDVERLRWLSTLCKLSAGNKGIKGNWPNGKEVVAGCVNAVSDKSDEMRADLANETLTLLSARIAAFTVEAAQARRAEGRLEFHDLLVLARQLLRRSPEARAALSVGYRVIMLDEFQDTDPIQIELALLLAGSETALFTGEWRDLSADPGRLFMVGDPKQSIYRFRRADIDLFLKVRDKYSDGGLHLTQNFRTVAPIIAAVNGFFADVMGDGSHTQAAYSPLTPTRAPSTADHRPTVLGGPIEGSAEEVRTIEAQAVASAIVDIVEHPDDWLVKDRKDSPWRCPNLSDITILLPTRTSLRQLTTELEAQNISYRADTGTLVYETQEVRDLLSVLRAIDDPSDSIALVASLRSVLYACGDDDLLEWRERGGRWDIRSEIPDALLVNPVAEAIHHLRSLSEARWWNEPSKLLMRLLDERHVFGLAAARRRPRDAWRRIRYVLDQARAFSEAGGGDLRAYLRWTDLQGVDGSKAHEPMLAEADDDAVQIMTIHGSKGLEFPITFVSGLTTEKNRARPGVAVTWGEPGTLPEVKIKTGLSTAFFDVRNDLEAEMDSAEKDRLLYVAMTRARDHLIVSGHHRVAKSGRSTPSHGLALHEFAVAEPAGFRRTAPSAQGSLFDAISEQLPDSDEAPHSNGERDESSSPNPPDAREWADRRQLILKRASNPRVRSATALAQEVRDELADRSEAGEDIEAWANESDSDGSLPPLTFRRGRAGTAIGSAVHGVLQLVNLANPAESDLAGLVESQAWAESVPEHAETILASVRSVLEADIVQLCASVPHWKELYVAAPVGDLTVEGYVDLLVDTPDGLVVVDYKTDTVRTDADVDRKLDGYSMQGAAYAVAIETAVGRPVVDVQFVFARPSGPIVRSVHDLDSLRARVRDRAATA